MISASHPTHRSLAAGALGAALLCATGMPAQAAVTFDKGEFLAALEPDATVIDFEGLVGTPGYEEYIAGGYFERVSHSLAGVTFTSTPYVYIMEPETGFDLDGNASGMFNPSAGGSFTLDTPASALGFDWGLYEGSGTVIYTLNFSEGSPILVAQGNTEEGVSFFGYYGERALTSIEMEWTGYYFQYDNVTYGAQAVVPGAVPEPATWAMLIGGFAFVGGAMRRRRGGTAALSHG